MTRLYSFISGSLISKTVLRGRSRPLRCLLKSRKIEESTKGFGLGAALSTSASVLNEHIIRSSFSDVELPKGNVYNTIFRNVGKWGSRIAMECAMTGETYTYNQLLEAMAKWAGFLKMLGIEKGDVIAIAMPNCLEYVIAKIGAMSIGVVVSPINNNYTPEELLRQISNSKAKLLVGHPSIEKTIEAAARLSKGPFYLVMNGPSTIADAINMQAILKDTKIKSEDPADLTGEEVATMLYSSGTTGLPKGVVTTHNATAISVNMITHPAICPFEIDNENKQESTLCMLPFYHLAGTLGHMQFGLLGGAKLIIMPTFVPDLYINMISKHKCECLLMVPPVLNMLVHYPNATRESLASVRAILIGAAPVSPTMAKAFKEKLQKDIFIQEAYGMTEVGIITVTPLGSERLGASGKILSNVSAKVVDTITGETLPPTETGEICFKTPAMMKEYYQNEEATAATFDKDGWLHSGDVGRFTEDGYLQIVDRTKELIKVKGLQVSPSELEDVLRRHPEVIDVGVTSVPHDRNGEAPRAYIVSKSNVTEDDIHRFMEARVAPHKKLVGGVAFVQQLPKTPTGKLLRRQLKELTVS